MYHLVKKSGLSRTLNLTSNLGLDVDVSYRIIYRWVFDFREQNKDRIFVK